MIARKTDGAFLALNDSGVNLNAKYEILEFMPYAYEIFNDVISLDANDHVIEQGGKAGRYSGYADLAKSSPATGLISPGSNFSTEVVETIKDLTCREDTNATCVDFTKKDGGVVAIFSDVYYNVQDSFGYKGDITKLDIAKVGVKDGQSGLNGNTLEISGFDGKQISEQYHLAYTANAIVPEQSADPKDTANGVFDLNLYYDYRPWMGEKYKQNGEKATLAKNVTRFVFTEKNGVIVLKLCMRAKNSEITICKSKAVY